MWIGHREKQVTVDRPIRYARHGLHYICGRNPAYPVMRDPEPCFFRAVRLAVCSVRTSPLLQAVWGKQFPWNGWQKYFLELQEQKAWNINLVTAGHFAPQVAKALELAKNRGLQIPVVYNTSGYEKVETLRMFEGLTDIYLPDFKYLSGELAGTYSHAADYPQVAKAALWEMVRQVGSARFEIVSGAKAGKITDELSVDVAYADGMDQTLDGTVSDTDECMRDSEPENGVLERMLRGVIVRHLILPGHIAESKKVIRYLYETYGDQIYISIMNQYTPMPGINARYPELGRKLTPQEYDEVVDYAIELGVENGFIQDGETAEESFIPTFDTSGV